MKPLSRNRGSALLLVLWSIITMSVAVLGVVQYVHYNLDEAQGINLNFELRQIAESGVAIAFSPEVEKGDPLLKADFGNNGGRYEVVLHSEMARLNVNELLLEEREEIGEDVLQRLFVNSWGANSADARHVVQQLILRTSRLLNDDGTFRLDRELTSIDQMAEVDGMDKIIKLKPDWADFFTVYGDGPLDVNGAHPDILRAFFVIAQRRAESFVQMRSGPDKKEHTLDDKPFTEDTVPGALGINSTQFTQEYINTKRVSITDKPTMMRVESTAFLGERKRQIRVILDRSKQPPAILQWQEVPL
ncbi:MAG TPA: hypothetical protein VF585_01135 [Chthoniobacterales bacterium]|jgi:hypothetical protein